MKKSATLLLAAFLALNLSGCIIVSHDSDRSDWQEVQRKNQKGIAELELDLDRSYVVAKLGAPSFSEAFTRDGEQFRVLYYRTQHRHSDDETTLDETTPLIFKNDKLIGWGEQSLSLVK